MTNDIAVAMRTPTKYAEAIKHQHACVLPHLVNEDETIEVQSVADRPSRVQSKKLLADVVNARYEELFALVLAELRRSGFERLVASGVVITGGAARVEGAVELAESVFGMPVRIGMPQHVTGMVEVLTNPSYATGAGLLLYGYEQLYQGGRPELISDVGVRGVWGKMKGWFQGNL